jgi:ribosomal subunit interface protein
MQITVTGHQIDVGRALHDYVQERLGDGVVKYFDSAIEGHVAFSREGPNFRTQIQVHVGKGMTWESQADNADIHTSFNQALDHIEKQLRRHKRKLRDHARGREPDAGPGGE